MKVAKLEKQCMQVMLGKMQCPYHSSDPRFATWNKAYMKLSKIVDDIQT